MTDPMSATPTPSRGSWNPRGGRGRQRGLDANYSTRARGFRSDRGGRGRPNRDAGAVNSNNPQPATNQGQPGESQMGVKDHVNGSSANDQDKPAEDGELCFICASTIEYLAIAPCNHQTCHICALRLRALYKKRDCAYCKVSQLSS
jgi:E3 ubiquitin-protein ligase ZNF598